MTRPSSPPRLLAMLMLLALVWGLPSAAAWIGNAVNNNKKQSAPPPSVKILILPGFGNDYQDYFLDSAPEGSLVQSLQERGWGADCRVSSPDDDTPEKTAPQVRVLPVNRSDWFQVFTRGIFDWNFWANQAPPTGPAFGWYLDLICDEIQALCPEPNDRVVLLGHSAGGWLARAALGYCSGKEDSTTTTALDLTKVLGLVTLGTPHLPPPPEIMDMTRGALRLTHETFPGAYHNNDNHRLFYITVMGQGVQGVEQQRTLPWEPTTRAGFAFESYQQVCGTGATIGDGVVPVSAGHLDGATQIDLPQVLHSINAPAEWYGSTNVIDSWHSAVMDALAETSGKTTAMQQPSWAPRLFQ